MYGILKCIVRRLPNTDTYTGIRNFGYR